MNQHFHTIYARHGDKHYKLVLSHDQAVKYDNGVMISCGLTIPEDMPETALRWLISRHRAAEVTYDEWNHSGCKSSFVMRGGAECLY